MAYRTRVLSTVGLTFWLIGLLVALTGLLLTGGGWDVGLTFGAVIGVGVIVVMGLLDPKADVRPEPGMRLATPAETIRTALVANGIGVAWIVGFGFLLSDAPRPWTFMAVFAALFLVLEGLTLWRVARAERAHPDLILARARWWRPVRFGWPRAWGATAP
ncbi:MAG TPA: hypothetical protein VNT55_18850 [Baekduia sp.]|nr:hypothetical protein [Baekduia sp.]